MLPENLDDLKPPHIQALIDAEVAESLSLEFKEQLPTSQRDDKKEFLYDVAAMANSAGGYLVFGVADRRGPDKQSTGIADGFSGMRLPNAQAEISRLANLIRDGIEPRLSGGTMQHVTTPDGDVLVIRISRSWAAPILSNQPR